MPATTTVIPPGTRIEGRVECSGDLVVEGRCDGELRVTGEVTVAAGAVCSSSIRASAAVVLGDVIGNVVCSDRVVVQAGARVVGDIRSPDVSIDADAEVDGTVDVLPPAPEEVAVARTRGRPRGGALTRPVPPPRPGASR